MAKMNFRSSGYSLVDKPAELLEWRQQVADLEHKLANDIPVYVSFRDARREGSIARIKTAQITEHAYYQGSYWNRSGPGTMIPSIGQMTVGWDDRKNILNVNAYDVFHEDEHDPTVGTVYKWTQTVKPKEEPKTVVDQIGEPVNPGDFVGFVERRYGFIKLRFGTVTRITPKGTVFVQVLKIKDNEETFEAKCNQDNIVIINNQLMNRLTMAKLAAN